jgi:2-polyprenyl-6-methoxyphenol hydroxylase-like FAD-dependent oxidoreductase
MENPATTCVIAGGGPAGMMAGFLLARAGVDVIVLEKHKDFLRDFRGDTIHPSTLELMRELGLLEKFLALPHTQVRNIGVDIGDEKFIVGDFSRISTHCKFMALMPQWDFLDFLSTQAKRHPHFRLMMESEVTGTLDGDARIAGVVVRTPGGDVSIRANLVIAADGRHSTLRAKAHLAVRNIGAPFDVLWLSLPAEKTDPTEPVGRVADGQFLVMLYRGDHWQCAFVIPKGGFDMLKAEGMDAFRARLRNVAGFARNRVSTIESFDQVKLLTVAIDRLERWACPGLLCVGDAAHAMSPMGGVGINLAIQDAVATANILAPVLRWGAPSLHDLEKIQKRREFPAKVIQWFQVQAQNRILAPTLRQTTTPKPPWLLRLVSRSPWLQHWPAQLIGVGVRPEHVKSRG